MARSQSQKLSLSARSEIKGFDPRNGFVPMSKEARLELEKTQVSAFIDRMKKEIPNLEKYQIDNWESSFRMGSRLNMYFSDESFVTIGQSKSVTPKEYRLDLSVNFYAKDVKDGNIDLEKIKFYDQNNPDEENEFDFEYETTSISRNPNAFEDLLEHMKEYYGLKVNGFDGKEDYLRRTKNT
jgi:hypothetical protein